MDALELAPSHVKKAKLMFFWSRYPDTVQLKTYFPDIQDNAKFILLERRFRGFRNFFFNQLERYAWQAINDGVNNADDLCVNKKSEIYKLLKSHFDQSNCINVPDRFREVIEFTLRAYFCHIQSAKENRIEQSPKKLTTSRKVTIKLRKVFGIEKNKNEINSEEKWEKFIYAAVSKMDESVPDYFKDTDFSCVEHSSKPLNRAAFTDKLNTIYTNRLKHERQ